MLNNKWGYINREGEWLLEPRFKQAYHFRGELALVVDEETVGYINKQGEFIWRVPIEETVSGDPGSTSPSVTPAITIPTSPWSA